MCKNKISHDSVEFYFKGNKIEMDKDGRIEYWPDGFLDATEKLLNELFEIHYPSEEDEKHG